MHVLVTGATGYVGGLLVQRLLDAGHRVRVLEHRVEGYIRLGEGGAKIERTKVDDWSCSFILSIDLNPLDVMFERVWMRYLFADDHSYLEWLSRLHFGGNLNLWDVFLLPLMLWRNNYISKSCHFIFSFPLLCICQ